MEYIKRKLERKILSMNSVFKAVLVTGARQVGTADIICMTDTPFPIDENNNLIPSNII